MCKNARLWETVHTLLNFDKDDTIVVGHLFKVIKIDKLGREVTEFHVHEFQAAHWCVEVEILWINGA